MQGIEGEDHRLTGQSLYQPLDHDLLAALFVVCHLQMQDQTLLMGKGTDCIDKGLIPNPFCME
ncbi:MAG: hypothetical protein F6J87_02790 [Spirulina sp. SIO3F2]|nr:hypothetical protein [Spirulina sp. SIO3F2]